MTNIPSLSKPVSNILKGYLGAVSIRKTVLPGMAIPMLKIRRPNGRLIFNMEITIRRQDGLYIETGPRVRPDASQERNPRVSQWGCTYNGPTWVNKNGNFIISIKLLLLDSCKVTWASTSFIINTTHIKLCLRKSSCCRMNVVRVLDNVCNIYSLPHTCS